MLLAVRLALNITTLSNSNDRLEPPPSQERIVIFVIYSYDPEGDHWTQVQSMHHKRLGVGIAVLNRLLYAIGGFDGRERLKSLECYHPENNEWTLIPPMSIGRSGAGNVPINCSLFYSILIDINHLFLLGAAALNQFIYVVGGFDGTRQLSSVERYDTERQIWDTVAPIRIARSALSLTVLDGKLYAMGGFDGLNFLAIVEVYDPETNRWEEGTPLTSGRSGHASAVIYQPSCVVDERSVVDKMDDSKSPGTFHDSDMGDSGGGGGGGGGNGHHEQSGTTTDGGSSSLLSSSSVRNCGNNCTNPPSPQPQNYASDRLAPPVAVDDDNGASGSNCNAAIAKSDKKRVRVHSNGSNEFIPKKIPIKIDDNDDEDDDDDDDGGDDENGANENKNHDDEFDDDEDNHDAHGAAERLISNDTKYNKNKDLFCGQKGQCSVAAIRNSLKKRFLRNIDAAQQNSKNYCKFRCKK